MRKRQGEGVIRAAEIKKEIKDGLVFSAAHLGGSYTDCSVNRQDRDGKSIDIFHMLSAYVSRSVSIFIKTKLKTIKGKKMVSKSFQKIIKWQTPKTGYL